ncbi:MAG: hypothetical protein H7A40_06970, partial [Chlamydiales bacterium]|nr:hypothetical protein [Chlamydiales bacterium]
MSAVNFSIHTAGCGYGVSAIVGEQVREVSASRPEQALGAKAWAHLGDVGEEPPLPEKIHEILVQPCPAALGLERFGKTIGETHILALIPKTLDGAPLTLERFKQLLDERGSLKVNEWKPGGHEAICASSSYWALISKDCIKGSRMMPYAAQKLIIDNLGGQYKLPKLIELLFGLYLQRMNDPEELQRIDAPQFSLMWHHYSRCE